ncbi:DedA family protein [Candidatus Uhrbacteria bacterium]|nr:DedA family protein [Candidatus Uhrbacteria bacterium]
MDVINLGFTTIPIEDIGYLAIFLIMTLDGANIPFTPNELFLAFTGYLARTGEVNTVAAFAAGLFGSFTGHLASYLIGWKFGRPFFRKYGKFVFMDTERLQAVEDRIKSYGKRAPFIVRFLPGLRNAGSLILGVFRFDPGPFLILTGAGIAVYNALFFLSGFVLGEQLAESKQTVFILMVGILAFGLSLAAVSWYRTRNPRASSV